MLEETNSSGVAQADYVYLNSRPIAVLNGSTVYMLHDDRLGTPQLASDSSQNIQWQAGYEPFGATTSVSGTITQNLRLPGQYFDVESGWNHNGFRDYAPGLGRYIEPDPLGRAGSGNNLYTYAEDDPIDLDDPFGEQAVPNPTPPAPGPVLVPRTPPFIEPLPEPVNPFWILLTLLFNSQPLNMDEVKWDQRQAEHDAYKEYCRPPSLPESMDPCAQLSRLIDHTNKCIALMQARDAKWQPNRHDEDIQNLFNRLQNLKDEHNRNCAKQCK